MFDLFDIHSHLNFKDFDADREEVIAQITKRRIGTITVGTDLKSSKEAADLARRHDNLFASIGLHPADNRGETFSEAEFAALVKDPKVVAIGECGLDYTFARSGPKKETPAHINEAVEKKRQKAEFEKQIEFAVENDKPLMIHCRDAYSDVIAILQSKKKEFGDKLRGNFHFFTSPIEIARQCLELGFTVSFTGPITFVAEYADIVKYVPLPKMMAETDAPFAAPVPYRGKRNNPLYVEEIVKKIAAIKGLNLDRVKKQLANNVFDIFLKKIS
jgi:TatD DNase family protein